MKPVIGKVYQVAPDWFVVLKSAKRAVIVQRTVTPNEYYVKGQRDPWNREPKEFIYFLTARKGCDSSDMQVSYGLAEAIKHAEWAPWPRLPETRGYETLLQAVEGIFLSGDVAFDFTLLIKLLGHDGTFSVMRPENPEAVASYWAAAAKLKPDMAVITQHLTDNPYWREWAIRLAALHRRPVSSMEMVSLCTSEQQSMREFALTVTTIVEDTSAPTAGSGSRRRA